MIFVIAPVFATVYSGLEVIHIAKTKTRTAEEREAARLQKIERAMAQKTAARRREKELLLEKKINICDYLTELTGYRDLSIARMQEILACECTIIVSHGQEKVVNIRQLISHAVQKIRRKEQAE